MSVHSTDDTEPKSTKRMPFKLYISIMSHYSTPSCTVGEFISSARLLLGHQNDHPPVCRYFGCIPNIARMFTEDSGILWPSDRKWNNRRITRILAKSLKECPVAGMYIAFIDMSTDFTVSVTDIFVISKLIHPIFTHSPDFRKCVTRLTYLASSRRILTNNSN